MMYIRINNIQLAKSMIANDFIRSESGLDGLYGSCNVYILLQIDHLWIINQRAYC